MDVMKGSYGAVNPVCQQIIAVSSAAPAHQLEAVERLTGKRTDTRTDTEGSARFEPSPAEILEVS